MDRSDPGRADLRTGRPCGRVPPGSARGGDLLLRLARDRRCGRLRGDAGRELLLVALSFMLGTILALAVLGALAGSIGQLAGAALGKYWKFAAGVLVVFFGLAGLGLVPFRLPQIDLGARPRRRGIAGPIVYGLAVGGAATACSACCNPLLAVVAGAATARKRLWQVKQVYSPGSSLTYLNPEHGSPKCV